MKEIWKNVKEFPNYQVSNLGRIKSLDKVLNVNGGKFIKKGKILKPKINNSGYKEVCICNEKRIKYISVHRLVAEAFLKKENFKFMKHEDINLIDINKLIINHKDENKQNNNVNNLEWCTYSYNTNYGTGIKRAKEKKYKKVNQYDMNGNFIKTWDCIKEAEKFYNIHHISNVCMKKYRYKTCGGYIWKYE